MTEKNWYLKNCQLFEHLSVPELQWLEGRSRVRQFARHSHVYLPAHISDGVFLVVNGRVKICGPAPEGKQTILAFIEPGEVFGELALVDAPSERDEQAVTTEKSTIVLIPSADLLRIVEQNPQLAFGVTRLIGMRRRRIERRLKSLLFHSNRDRLTNLLMELAEDYGRVSGNNIELSIRLSHQDLASVIGSTRETVTLTLGEMQEEGLIEMGRRRVTLCGTTRWSGGLRAPNKNERKQPNGFPLPGTGPLGPAAT